MSDRPTRVAAVNVLSSRVTSDGGLTLIRELDEWLSVIDRAQGRPVRGYFRLLIAVAAQPHWCKWHLKQLAKDWISGANRSTAFPHLARSDEPK
jgi:hypothetical protein